MSDIDLQSQSITVTGGGKRFWLKGLDEFSEGDFDRVWEARSEGEAQIIYLGISMTSGCNLDCIYCYAGDPGTSSEKLTGAELCDLVSQGANVGVKSVIIGGSGEPTLDSDLMPVISQVNEEGMTSVLVTSGNVFGDDELCQEIHGRSSEEFIQFLRENTVSIVMKLDTLEDDRYDHIVGKEDAHEDFKNGLQQLFDNGFGEIVETKDGQDMTNVSFSTVVSKLNIVEVRQMREFAWEHNAQYICKFPSMVGNAQENDWMFFDPSESSTAWLRNNYAQYFSEKPQTLTVDQTHCGVWHYGCVIGETGNLRMCYTAPAAEPLPELNIRNYSLEELLQKREEALEDMLEYGESCHVKRSMYEGA